MLQTNHHAQVDGASASFSCKLIHNDGAYQIRMILDSNYLQPKDIYDAECGWIMLPRMYWVQNPP